MQQVYEALLAQEKLVPLGWSWIDFPETYRPRPHCGTLEKGKIQKGCTYHKSSYQNNNQVDDRQEDFQWR